MALKKSGRLANVISRNGQKQLKNYGFYIYFTKSKAATIWELLSTILFIFYIVLIIMQIIFWVKNVQKWKLSYKLIQYMPLLCADYLKNYPLSDLHLIFALIIQNDQARKVTFKSIRIQKLVFQTIWVGNKVLTALHTEELYKFLPVLMEVGIL